MARPFNESVRQYQEPVSAQEPLLVWQVTPLVPGDFEVAVKVAAMPLTVVGMLNVAHALAVTEGSSALSLFAIAATTPFAADLASDKQAFSDDFLV